MTQPFTIRRTVQFSETDMAGVMHFSNYLRWMEDAEHAFWRSLGLSVHDACRGEGGGLISWPRVAVNCQYSSPARFEDELELTVRPVKLGAKSLTFEIEFRRGAARVALGTTTAVCCRVEPGGAFQAIAIPDAIRRRLTPFVDAAPT
ncbi:MAG: acyl-CoA thioesterase [Phycisphaerae bacterium]|jgi:YbgC/YbaW family acyl-CoA thioester hydrolase